MQIWLEKFLLSLVVAFLERMATRAQKEYEDGVVKKANDEANGARDDENTKKYHDAESRAEKIRAALDLLNRTHS